jgi:predicted GIY-YIG superfamily endonuclease
VTPETCVYQYFNVYGRLLYVGITNRGHQRANEHAKSKSWWKDVRGASIEHHATRDEALLRESYLIATYRPLHNIQHANDRSESVRMQIEGAGYDHLLHQAERPTAQGMTAAFPGPTRASRRRARRERQALKSNLEGVA